MKEKMDRTFERHLFWAMMFGLGYGATRRRVRSHYTVCKGESGRIRYFSGRKVCELFDIHKISKITQYEDGDTRILATLEDGKKIYTDPRTLNRFQSEFSVNKKCSGRFCEFERESL